MGIYCYFNGSIQKEAGVSLSVHDLSIRRGYGAFDFMRAEGVQPMFHKRYFKRFRRALSTLSLEVQEDDRRLREVIDELLTLNGYQTSGLRFIVTGGYADDAYTPTKPNFIITNDPLSYPAAVHYEQGVDLLLHEFQRELYHIKSINYLTPISLLPKMKEEGYYDVLYHMKGSLSEVSRSNFFIIKDDVLHTPSQGILEGITRQLVIELAQKSGVEVKQHNISLTQLYEADEAFLTSTTKRILPVTRVAHKQIGDGKVGKLTKRLQNLFSEMEVNYLQENA